MVDYIKMLEKEIDKINDLFMKIGLNKKVFKKEVKVFGNGAHITLPREYINKRVHILVD